LVVVVFVFVVDYSKKKKKRCLVVVLVEMRSSLFFFLNTEEAAQKRAKSENECSFERARCFVSRERERKRVLEKRLLSFFARLLYSSMKKKTKEEE
jgi:hypothetical protein